MSAGAFVNTKYSTAGGVVVPIRVQPETLLATLGGTANSAPAGDVVAGYPSAKVSGSKRKFGINARTVSMKFTAAVPDGYAPNSIVRIPWLQQTSFNSIGKGTTGTYLGVAVQVIGRSGEEIV